MNKHQYDNALCSKPLVSIIIPSYNHAPYIENAIKSAVEQDYQNLEIIVIDDGSSDNTKAVLEKIPRRENLTIIINEKNNGQSAVLNQALKISRGEYICLLPSDDWYLPNKVSLQIEKFLQSDNDVGVIYGKGARFYPQNGKILEINLPMHSGWVLTNLVKNGNFVYPVTPMFKRECFDFAKPDESYRAEGEAIYLKIAIKYKFDYVDKLVGVMRDHENNTGKKLEMMLRDNVRYWNEFFSRNDISDDIKKLRNVTLAKLYRTHAFSQIFTGANKELGRGLLFKSLQLQPFDAFNPKTICAALITFMPDFIYKYIIKKYNKFSND